METMVGWRLMTVRETCQQKFLDTPCALLSVANDGPD